MGKIMQPGGSLVGLFIHIHSFIHSFKSLVPVWDAGAICQDVFVSVLYEAFPIMLFTYVICAFLSHW